MDTFPPFMGLWEDYLNMYEKVHDQYHATLSKPLPTGAMDRLHVPAVTTKVLNTGCAPQ